MFSADLIKQNFVTRVARTHNSTCPQAGVLCLVGQESSKFEVQCFVGSSVVKAPAFG
jgi:hypothetical protein